jgi:hypothetical protein
MFGWILKVTHVWMIARNGNMQIFPMSPVNVILSLGRAGPARR